jgi:hypothetical protein
LRFFCSPSRSHIASLASNPPTRVCADFSLSKNRRRKKIKSYLSLDYASFISKPWENQNMPQKRNQIYNYLLKFLLFFIIVSAGQTMEVEEVEVTYAVTGSESSSEEMPQDPMASIMNQAVFDLLDGCTTHSHISNSQSPSASSQEDEITATSQQTAQELLDQTVQFVARRTPRQKTIQHMCAGGVAIFSLLPSGILMSGFGNLSFALVFYGIPNHSNTTIPLTMINPINETFPLVPVTPPFEPLYPPRSDPDNIGQTIGFAIPPCLIQSLLAYHGVDWIFAHLSGCCTKTSQNIPSGGWKASLLKAAYSWPMKRLNGLFYEAFYFNLVATQVSHRHGFGGGNVWAFILGGVSLPISFYLFDYLNRDSYQSPLYPLTEQQEQALEQLYIIKFIANRDGIKQENGLEDLSNVLETPDHYNPKQRNKAWQSAISKINLETLESIKYWYRVKRNIAMYASSFVQVAGLPYKGWGVYSLVNKFCWLATEVSPEMARNIALGATVVSAIPLALGAIAEQPRLYKAYMQILNGLIPEVSGYWGQRISPLLALGLAFWYLDIPTSYSYQREIEFNPYGNCPNIPYTNDTRNYNGYPYQGEINHYYGNSGSSPYANCTGNYYVDLDLGARFSNAAVFTGGIVWAASVHWFYQPLERSARWIFNKVSCASDQPCYANQRKTVSFTEKLRDITNKVWIWTSGGEEDPLI